jgi:pantoate--beta-alanine ligase
VIIASKRDELAAARADLTGTAAVVMTMGALHEGHASLLRAARQGGADHLIATIFVNPLQFGPSEDLDRYPRTLEADLDMCRAAGVELVFAPTVDVIYPDGEPQVRVTGGPVATILEGASRPGHFDGVLTVVHKLLHLTRADIAYYGEKDYQQLTLIRAMARDLDLPVEIVGVPTVREPDGLALSSRNRYLSEEQRRAAPALARALREGAAAAAAGAGADGALSVARKIIDGTPEISLDYLVVTDPQLGPAPARGEARMLVAARLGTTRLIDNLAVEMR